MTTKIDRILQTLDKLFEEYKMEEVEPFLQQALKESMETGDSSAVITIVNELIGFYRDTSQYEKSLYYCEQILPFMEARNLKGSIHYATTCLNVANACRAAGEWNASLMYYKEVKETYDKLLLAGDSLYASYYNNLSLLYQEMGRFEESADCLKKALAIMELYQDKIKIAITCSNLAASLLRTEERQEAEVYLNRALQIFIEDGEKDFHYGAALSVMGELQFQKNQYQEAKEYYRKALAELEKHVGKTEYYYRTLDNLEQVEKILAKVNPKPLGEQMFEDYFYEYGEPMLKKKFPSFLGNIAIGRVGEGSECFGFDDEISLDHDYGPGFCLWVTRETYHKIGKRLQEEYEKLPDTFRGVKRRTMEQGKGRIGVCIIEDFYQRILGMEKAPQTLEEWEKVEEFALAAAVNGKVLRDEEGIFSQIRKQIQEYYPESIWKSKLAQTMYRLSQYGQYNYGRMLKRKDIITAEQCRSMFVQSAMQMVYLLNKTYAPYYKWLWKGMEKLDSFGIRQVLQELVFTPVMNQEDNEFLMEKVCNLFLEEMEKKELLKRNSQTTYLEHYIGQVLEGKVSQKQVREYQWEENQPKAEKTDSGSSNEIKKQEFEKEVKSEQKKQQALLVEKLINLEWNCFDKVQNEGGRADCQDDWNTFSIMRRSQYLTWNTDMLESYIQDFEEAMAKGWNLITEKYGRMMESTTPAKYEQLKDNFPNISKEKKTIIEAIIAIQVTWMEEFAKEYPYMSGNSRVIHTSEDTPFSTSFETYLRGELSTYSDRTLDLYGRFIVEYLKKEENLTKDIMTNTALLYGYESLEQAEKLLAG